MKYPAPRQQRRHSPALLASVTFALPLLGLCLNANADAPDPVVQATQVSVVENADYTKTVTVKGSWKWTTHHTDCNKDRYAAGWAVNWNDPDQIGNYVGTINNVAVKVGAAAANSRNPADNTVHYYPGPNPARCGVYANHPDGSYNTGEWGPLSHTYSSSVDLSKISVCVVVYDIHADKKDKPKERDLWAGGDNNNHDNSVQGNAKTPLGNQCTPVPVIIWE